MSAPDDSIRPCEACEGEEIREVFEKKGHVLEQCGGCGLIRLKGRPSPEALEQLYTAHYQTRYEGNPAAIEEFLHHCRRNHLFFEAHARPGSVLDVGCSIGGFLHLCKGRPVCGIEINPATVRVARSHFGLEDIHQVTLEEFATSFPERRFDNMTFWDVLEHLPDPGRTLATARKLLRPGGRIFVNTPDWEGLFARATFAFRKLFGWYHPEPPRHLFQFGRRSLLLLTARHGFRTIAANRTHMSRRRRYATDLSRRWARAAYRVLFAPVEGAALLSGSGDLVTLAAEVESQTP